MTDIEIAQSIEMKPISEIAQTLNIPHDFLEPYGRYKAKLPLSLLNQDRISKSALILVTAITPTPAGEGKTTTSIGLHEGMRKIGLNSIAVLREPSLGPVFGMKGGAAGGGYAQVVPMEDINLHFTGDFAAIEKANNLLAAVIDNIIRQKDHRVQIDPATVLWKRVFDLNDRALREIIIGIGGKSNGVMRSDGFNITAASEIMAILCLSKDLEDLKRRISEILVGFDYQGQPVYAAALHVADAMTILLKDAIKPNLVQTLEGNPAILHGGPFANIAQGTNSLIATKMGLSLADYVITEAGFGADLGAEKFLDIKCVSGGLKPAALVLVATIRALKHHAAEKGDTEMEKLQLGFENLEKHIENSLKFGLKPVVAINHFISDTEEETNWLVDKCKELGIQAIPSRSWSEGGMGNTELAKAVKESIDLAENQFKPLYEWSDSVKDKIKKIATEIYGADDVTYSTKAESDIRKINKLGLDKLPVCMAKTQKSFSDNEKLRGRPKGFKVNVREFEIAAGAGFLIPILGNMLRMPGLPDIPASENMRIDESGKISGLS